MQKRIATMSVARAPGSVADARLTISTIDEDREGDVLVPEGAVLDAYRRNPVVLFGHSHYSIPIGRTVGIDVVPGRGIVADFVWLKNDEQADRVRNAFAQGVLNAASVGFLPLQSEPNGKRGFRHLRWELLEWSICPVPANPHATRLLKSLGWTLESDDDDEEVAVVFDEPADSPGREPEIEISVADVNRAVAEAVTDAFNRALGRVD